VAVGFGLQQLSGKLDSSGYRNDPLLDALHAEPIGQELQQVRAARASRRVSGSRGNSQLALTEPDQARPLDLEIRVALLSAGVHPALSSTGPWLLRSPSGQILQQGQGGDPVDLSLVRQVEEAWLSGIGQAALLANGQRYGGRFRLLMQGQGVQVINHLSLEQYIAAVVGSEMPTSWPLEALKAQAVAARSYALAHMARPANRHWHLGDTTRWQAYRGLERLNGRTQEAAVRTAGLILSYQGGIVESLYASTQQISSEAHGHLGASMSQHGARTLAEQGHRYNAILGRYYPGASLARLRSGAG
jgi:stage II sporulation protein D